MNNNSPFRVLDGGLAHCPDPKHKEIRSCWVTDTRLMGVVVVCIRWKSEDPVTPDLFQYFYFDYEEYGLDRYESYAGTDPMELADLEASLIGGLGGIKVAILPSEAVHLVKTFLAFNRRHDIEMPFTELDGMEVLFYEEMPDHLSPEDIDQLDQKTCVRLHTENALANYFMIRCCGRDFQGAKLLTDGDVELDLFPELAMGNLYRNKVIPAEDRNGCHCEALVEANGEAYILITELDFYCMKITGYRRISKMKLSPEEFYMNLSQSEFVTLYQFDGDPEDVDRNAARITQNAEILPEHEGRTLMIYNKDNSHVEESVYRQNNDVYGVIHVSHGQLLASSRSLRNIHKIEIDLHLSRISDQMEHIASFEFTEPVLMRYLDSDFPDFLEYVEAIKSE